MDTLTQDISGAHSSTSNITVTAQHKLLAACPCLNVKLHLAAEPEHDTILTGKELKLGLAGVSVEQKILCSLSISKDVATVRCLNCDQEVYTFQPSSSFVNLEPTSLAFLASSILFSPSNGIVVPSEGVVTGQDIDMRVKDPNYSKAFRLILAPTLTPTAPPSSASMRSASATTLPSSTPRPSSSPSLAQPSDAPLYRPHLERVRTLLDKELEANLNAQQQRTEARIEAFKSQQLLALRESIEITKKEKERLWKMIQERVAPPPPPQPSTPGTTDLGSQDGFPNASGSQYTLDVPNTLPIRLTNASRVEGAHSQFLDRRRSSVSDMAMSLQFREFDQRMASNSLRRQSIVPDLEITATTSTIDEPVDLTLTNTAANAATSSMANESQADALNPETSSPSSKSKKKVTISDTIRRVSIVEPQNVEENDIEGLNGDDGEVDGEEDEEGVVFDMDEELGFDEDEEQVSSDMDAEDDDQGLDSENDSTGAAVTSNGKSNGIAITDPSRGSLPKSGMVVGSLRAKYLRRQRGLEQRHRQSIDDDDFDEEFDEDDNDNSAAHPGAAMFGTSLPIQIQPRSANIKPAPPAARTTSTLATSLAIPPSSTPAAAMLQRRLSRAYGADIMAENSNISHSATAARSLTSAFTGSFMEGGVGIGSTTSSSFVPPITGTAPGSMMIDPLMLLEEDNDNDDVRGDSRSRRRRQSFSAINHRRDLEKHQDQQQQQQADSVSKNGSYQVDFEPPHLYSARTYVGSTPWEMPTRVTVKSGGMQREGTHLDREIALEMAKELELERQELELERQEQEETHEASSAKTNPIATLRTVDRIDEGQEDEEDDTLRTE
ncbi:hypothetical protein BX616_000579 [Lobosporangium transversale]|uniref:Uncharacterized protein n=1 Tax=Lobosporangium transversale TaxID=64571 RepID=A0A1Y2GW00_9FUNG|nr:hypothetical protein BCR41DRAFT_420904 [Lobosporangium transversale]KAF9906935.1 hypothetical protein BX616_000579 [Lobosporangium transversale]ORZ20853.1 hypothetical protein BCR41DRAFT_420904 [Lobosporangium transversale]|eukprot:XP_021882762.1 hypothetical protein BCR41DRAFT_420904 [Lobosporangium transversale]